MQIYQQITDIQILSVNSLILDSLHTQWLRVSRMNSYLENLAPLGVTIDVLAGMKHAQCHAVQQDHQHGRSLEPCGDLRLRRTTTRDKRSRKQTNQKGH